MAVTGVTIALGVALSAWWADKSATSLSHNGRINATQWAATKLRGLIWRNTATESGESASVESRSRADIPEQASDEVVGSGPNSPTAVKAGRIHNYVRSVAGEIKLRYPIDTLTMCTADKLSVQAAVRECFKRDNLRMCDQIRYMGLIVTMVFTPSLEEIRDRRDLQSRARADLIAQFEAGTRDHWLDALLHSERRVGFARH